MSESFLDLGYTSPDDAIRYRQMRNNARRKPLTSSQENWRKNQRARNIEEAHAHTKEHGILEPDADTLRNMSADTKADIIDNIQKAKAALAAAKAGIGNTVEIEQLPELAEPIQEQLPFD